MSQRDVKVPEVLTGVFVIAALLILGAATLWIAGATPLGEERSSYEVLMKNAGGVRPGDQVRVSGVQVGRVEEVRLQPGEEWPVAFVVAVDAAVPVTAESQASFAADGLLGTSYLEISTGPAGAERLPPGGRISGSEAGGIAQTMAKVDDLADRAVVLLDETTVLVRDLQGRAEPIFDRAEALLSDDNVAHLTATVKTLRRTLDAVGPRLPELLERLDALATDLQTGAAKLPQLADDFETLVEDLQAAVGPEGEHIVATLDAAGEAFAAVDGAFSTVETSSGEIEAMLHDLREASANLKAFSQRIKEQPANVLRTVAQPDRKPGEGVRR